MRMPFFIGVMRYEKECAGRRGSSTCWWKKYQQPVIYVPVLTTRYMLHWKMYRRINHWMEFHQETSEYSDGKYLHSAHRIDMTWPLDILKSSKVYPCHFIVNSIPSLNYTITHRENNATKYNDQLYQLWNLCQVQAMGKYGQWFILSFVIFNYLFPKATGWLSRGR